MPTVRVLFPDQESCTSQEEVLSSTSSMTGKPLAGAKLKLYQFWALFVKRFHHHRRDFQSYFSQLFLPIVFLCLAMACTLIKPSAHNLPSILLNPSIYGPGTSMFFRCVGLCVSLFLQIYIFFIMFQCKSYFYFCNEVK